MDIGLTDFVRMPLGAFKEEAAKLDKKFWLMKTEPETYSFADLIAKPQSIDRWEGVRNYVARNYMRDAFAEGDEAFFYHSSTQEPAIVGVTRIVRSAYPDPTALDP